MGRKSSLTDRQWAEENEDQLRAIVRAMKCAEYVEKSVIVMLKLFLLFGDLEKVLRVSKIHRHKFEFNVGGGRIDLILFHMDGGISIIEAKSEYDIRTIAAGIGQVCMYAAQLPSAIRKSKPPKYINRILTAPIEPERCTYLLKACEMAGVKFVPLPSIGLMKSLAENLGEVRGWPGNPY